MNLLSLVVALTLAPAAASGSDSSFLASAAGVQQALKAQFARTPMLAAFGRQEEDTLLELTRDRDAEVRRNAVKALKAYVSGNYRTRDRVLEMLRDWNETAAVKYECIKSLSWASGESQVYDRLLEIAKRDNSTRLRAIAWKALYWQAFQRSDVRSDALYAARYESDPIVRRAAVWTLFGATGMSDVRDYLLDLAKHSGDSALRVEALKSLYQAMGMSEVRDLAYHLAKYELNDPAVREAAILMLANRVSNDQRDLLEDIAQRDNDARARRAAILALGSPSGDDIYRYFHLVRRDIHGQLVHDPLDDE